MPKPATRPVPRHRPRADRSRHVVEIAVFSRVSCRFRGSGTRRRRGTIFAEISQRRSGARSLRESSLCPETPVAARSCRGGTAANTNGARAYRAGLQFCHAIGAVVTKMLRQSSPGRGKRRDRQARQVNPDEWALIKFDVMFTALRGDGPGCLLLRAAPAPLEQALVIDIQILDLVTDHAGRDAEVARRGVDVSLRPLEGVGDQVSLEAGREQLEAAGCGAVRAVGHLQG